VGGGCGLACASSWRSVAVESSCSCTTSLLRTWLGLGLGLRLGFGLGLGLGLALTLTMRTALARAAKRSVLCVSSQQVEAGLSVQTTVHSAEPPREFCSGWG